MSQKTGGGASPPRGDTCVIGFGSYGSFLAHQVHLQSQGRIPALGINGGNDGTLHESVSLDAWPPSHFSESLKASLRTHGGKRAVDLGGLRHVLIAGGTFSGSFQRFFKPVVDRLIWSDINVTASCILPFPHEKKGRRLMRTVKFVGMRTGTTFLYLNAHVLDPVVGKRELASMVTRTDQVVIDQMLFSALARDLFVLRESNVSPALLARGRYCVYGQLASGKDGECCLFGAPGTGDVKRIMSSGQALAVHLDECDAIRARNTAWAFVWDSDVEDPDLLLTTLPAMPVGYALSESVIALDVKEEAVEAFIRGAEESWPRPAPSREYLADVDEEDREIPAYIRKSRS